MTSQNTEAWGVKTFRASQGLSTQLKVAAKITGKSESDIIRDAITDYAFSLYVIYGEEWQLEMEMAEAGLPTDNPAP